MRAACMITLRGGGGCANRRRAASVCTPSRPLRTPPLPGWLHTAARYSMARTHTHVRQTERTRRHPPPPQERIRSVHPRTIILSGGPNSVHVEGAPRVPEGFFDYCAEESVAVLGICYGMQARVCGWVRACVSECVPGGLCLTKRVWVWLCVPGSMEREERAQRARDKG